MPPRSRPRAAVPPAPPTPPPLAIISLPIGELAAYLGNARVHDAAQVAQITASIREFGFNVPILVDAKNTVVAGHGRIMAARELGMDLVPTIRLGHLTPAQIRAYRLADNQIALNSAWDDSILAAELRALAAEDFNVDLLGFDDSQLQQLLGGSGGPALGDPDADAPAPPAVPISRPGDTWILGPHRLRCGDSTSAEDVAALLAGAAPHLMVTDPPYGVEYDADWRSGPAAAASLRHPLKGSVGKVANDHRADWAAAWALFTGDVAYVWHGERQVVSMGLQLQAAGLDLRNLVVWAKSHFAIGRGHYHPMHETCWYAVRKGGTGHWSGDRKQTTVWEIDKPQRSETGHSTQKPVACMQIPMENNARAGDAVYDPFVGSGTTIIAGQVSGRRVLAMELNPAYVDVAVRRWQDFTGQAAILDGEDATLDEVAAARGIPAAA